MAIYAFFKVIGEPNEYIRRGNYKKIGKKEANLNRSKGNTRRRKNLHFQMQSYYKVSLDLGIYLHFLFQNFPD